MTTEYAEHPKFQALLQAGKTLFWKHGVKRVSVQEICRTAGTSKVTFYRFFENKVALAKYLISKDLDESMLHYHQTMQEDIPFVERLEKLMVYKFENAQYISLELIQDIYLNTSLGLKDFIEERQIAMQTTFLDDLSAAQEAGQLRKDLRRPFLEYQLQQLQKMALDPQLLQHYDHPRELIMEVTRYFIYGLLPTQGPSTSS